MLVQRNNCCKVALRYWASCSTTNHRKKSQRSVCIELRKVKETGMFNHISTHPTKLSSIFVDNNNNTNNQQPTTNNQQQQQQQQQQQEQQHQQRQTTTNKQPSTLAIPHRPGTKKKKQSNMFTPGWQSWRTWW